MTINIEIISLVFAIMKSISNYADEEGSFGQEEVPLTVEIKEIPDGQIFKVYILYVCNVHNTIRAVVCASNNIECCLVGFHPKVMGTATSQN